MPRPRFHGLPAERQNAILRAALSEFSTRGFMDASLNNIISSTGISKGSMYYYFDDKVDLYGYLLRAQVKQMIAHAGPFPVPAATDPDMFWSTIEDYCLRLVEELDASPQIASLLRDAMSGTGVAATQRTEQDAEQAVVPWLIKALAAGQAAGAIRTDVADGLLLAVSTAIGKVIDSWVIVGSPDSLTHRTAVHTVIDMLRRAIQP
ncbi:hypothetical protein GCM10027568_30080 [Humibacter soli]